MFIKKYCWVLFLFTIYQVNTRPALSLFFASRSGDLRNLLTWNVVRRSKLLKGAVGKGTQRRKRTKKAPARVVQVITRCWMKNIHWQIRSEIICRRICTSPTITSRYQLPNLTSIGRTDIFRLLFFVLLFFNCTFAPHLLSFSFIYFLLPSSFNCDVSSITKENRDYLALRQFPKKKSARDSRSEEKIG